MIRLATIVFNFSNLTNNISAAADPGCIERDLAFQTNRKFRTISTG